MKLYKKIIILISLIGFLFCLFMVVDYYIGAKIVGQMNIHSYLNNYKKVSDKELADIYIYKKGKYRTNFAKIENENSKMPPILLFGDSFVLRNKLKKDETFAHTLALKTKRPIYNQSTPYSKVQHLYFSSLNDEFYKLIKKPKTIIYIYVDYHIVETSSRVSTSACDLFYRYKKGELQRYKNIPFYKKSYVISYLNAQLLNKNFYREFFMKRNTILYKKLLVETRKEMQKHWGKDFKFIVIRIFPPLGDYEDEMFRELQKEGFFIFDAYKYLNLYDNKKYQVQNILKIRPNGLYYKELSDLLIKKYNLK